MSIEYKWDMPVNMSTRTLAQIQLLDEVCREFNCERADIKKITRRRELVDARSVYAYLLHKHLHYTVVRIGEEINRNHSSVVCALRRVESYIRMKDFVKDSLESIENNFLTINKNL